MTNYISPAARRGSEATVDEPTSRRATRFDQRGIALQTVIIMVVLLAIAGGIAAVLLNRGGEAANQLENQATSVPASSYTNETLCKSAGYDWDSGQTGNDEASARCAFQGAADCTSAGGTHTSKTCTIAGIAHRAKT